MFYNYTYQPGDDSMYQITIGSSRDGLCQVTIQAFNNHRSRVTYLWHRSNPHLLNHRRIMSENKQANAHTVDALLALLACCEIARAAISPRLPTAPSRRDESQFDRNGLYRGRLPLSVNVDGTELLIATGTGFDGSPNSVWLDQDDYDWSNED
tara:strand:- start:220 stop:678 length:459 start_codon:yes stop_codon:yes gene_type:complete